MIKLNGEVVDIGHFPDGTILLKKNTSKYRDQASVTFTWHFESNEEMTALMFLVKHFRERTYYRLVLEMPYVPNARMDRVKNNEDVFTLKYFADFINYLNFDEVFVLDPHSSVSCALFNHLYVQTPEYFISKTVSAIKSKDILMFYPDEGSMKRCSELIKHPYCFGIKRRDWVTGKIEGLDVVGEIDKINGSDILIIDDICSRGGTFLHSARKLKELGANKIYLYVSHCENTILEGELLDGDLIEKMFTTNSIFTKSHEKIEVFEL